MLTNKSLSGAVGSNILSQAISKMKENNKYIGSGSSNYGGESGTEMPPLHSFNKQLSFNNFSEM